MSNMGYCHFENTNADISDCIEHFDDALPRSENRARNAMIKNAVEILEYIGVDLDHDDIDQCFESWKRNHKDMES